MFKIFPLINKKAMCHCIALFFLLLISCEEQTTAPEQDNADTFKGTMQISLDISDAPSEVSALKGKLSDDRNGEITFEFVIDGNSASALVENIPAGDWLLQVDAYNKDNTKIYSGSAK